MDLSAFYNQDLHSDVVLVLRTMAGDQPSLKRLRSNSNCDTAVISSTDTSMPAHGIVLANASQYFRARLSSEWQANQLSEVHEEPSAVNPASAVRQKKESEHNAVKMATALPATGLTILRDSRAQRTNTAGLIESSQEVSSLTASLSSNKRVLIEHVEEEEVSAVKAVIKSMYTGKLDKEVIKSPLQLLNCFLAASRFVVPHCIEQCSEAFKALPPKSFTTELLIKIYSLPPFEAESPQNIHLFQKAKQDLLAWFGDIPKLLRQRLMACPPCPTLLEQFKMLPYAAIHQWLQSDELVVHSENCVLTLLSVWVGRGDSGKNCINSQLTDLLKGIRVLQLTPSYLSLIPHISWLSSVLCLSSELVSALQRVQYQRLCLTHCQKTPHFQANHVLPDPTWYNDYKDIHIPRVSWLHPRRCGILKQLDKDRQLSWSLGAEELDSLYKGDISSLCSPQSMYCSGYFFSVLLKGSISSTVVVSYSLSILRPHDQDPVSGVLDRVMTGSHVEGFGCGWDDFLERTAPSFEELIAPLLVHGKLVIEAHVPDVL
ncbi:hypothetical protein CEUSTIGMA_g11353.t1 [Chlamydomonas eustigma]|uniref:BTB domain-containing protein n=1 Tax=Chlamydomonas eustigma TaxID=1157962 RepID=A0A250XLX2_9CHLO|nr:hypothetical protein CEUSTIGMA_g11353.t1 [Chlamydomonas eustigma]|eukprot:GAX83929.1 hypothetical protein CEUSTIGMA_g11353.t1 [Chlamydomonas eustigma]